MAHARRSDAPVGSWDERQVTGERPMRRHKYGAKPTVVDGIRFASMKEAKRYGELKMLQKAGRLWHLELQPEFELNVYARNEHGEPKRIGKYVADFKYFALPDFGEWTPPYDVPPFPVWVIEDVKGIKTPVYRLKKKMAEAIYGITIREV